MRIEKRCEAPDKERKGVLSKKKKDRWSKDDERSRGHTSEYRALKVFFWFALIPNRICEISSACHVCTVRDLPQLGPGTQGIFDFQE